MERWQFIQSPGGGWYWLCSDVISRRTRTSAETFQTQTECISNAMGYGYQKVAAPGMQAVMKNTPRRRRPKSGKHKRS